MDAREARAEFQAGRLPAERLLELLERQERLLQRLHAEVERLKQRLAQYEPDIQPEPTPTAPPPELPLGLLQPRCRRTPPALTPPAPEIPRASAHATQI